jgi:hypothetical protein
MSPASISVLLGAILEDFSQVGRPYARISARRLGAASSAVACRAVDAEAFSDHTGNTQPTTEPASAPATPVLIHGAAPAALAAWKSAAPGERAEDSRANVYGIDIARGLGRRGTEAAHSSLGMLAELPRSVPVTVSLSLGPGWRDTMALIRARGRGVRFHVYPGDSPHRRALADAIRAAVAEGCAFSWCCAAWQPVTEPAESTDTATDADGPGASSRNAGEDALPGILNILLATALAVQGAGSSDVAAELARTDKVDVVDAVREMSPATARRVRLLLRGFAVYRTVPVIDALTDLALLPKTVGRATRSGI